MKYPVYTIYDFEDQIKSFNLNDCIRFIKISSLMKGKGKRK